MDRIENNNIAVTEKLFYRDGYESAFEANVLKSFEADGKFAAVLDKTFFYPEGGGQPSDTGLLGGVHVVSVHEKNGEILHFTEKPVAVGSVSGLVDWKRRFSFMQNHTGEHIVSGIINKLYGLNNIGFHIGSSFMTIDINGALTKDELRVVEKEANGAVYSNVKVSAAFPSMEELEKIPYRSKKEITGDIRIVSIPGYDACACCGIHVHCTGEIGLIKLIDSQKYKSGTRIFMLCGELALDDYSRKNDNAYEISSLLSVKPMEITGGVRKLLDDYSLARIRLNEFQNGYITRRAAETDVSGDILLFENNFTPDDLRMLCLLLTERAESAFIFTKAGDNEYKYALGSKNLDMAVLCKKLNTALGGRGGGQKQLVQGSVFASREEIELFFSEFKSFGV